jgi:hypothetical protein
MRIITFDGVAAVWTEQILADSCEKYGQRHRIVSVDNLSVNLASLF